LPPAPQIGVHDVAVFNIELLRKEVFQNAAHERAGLICADDFTQIFERQVQAFEQRSEMGVKNLVETGGPWLAADELYKMIKIVSRHMRSPMTMDIQRTRPSGKVRIPTDGSSAICRVIDISRNNATNVASKIQGLRHGMFFRHRFSEVNLHDGGASGCPCGRRSAQAPGRQCDLYP
jgi:hypothetical protein